MKKIMTEWRQRLLQRRQQFETWWHDLGLRERKMIIAATIFIGILIAYEGIWSPYHAYIASLRTRILAQQKTLVWMQKADREITAIAKHHQPNKTIDSPVALLSHLQQQIALAGFNLQLKNLKQTANDAVQLTLTKVDFNQLMKMLIQMMQTDAIIIQQATIVATETSGIVNADLILSLT